MPRAIPFVFCRYEFAVADEPLTGREQLTHLRRIRGSMVAYRKPDPTPDDERNFVMRPKETQVSGHLVLTWEVAEQKTVRERTRYNKDRDEIWEEAVETDEIVHTKFIALPELGVLAVDDRLSDRTLGARPAVSRLKTIFEKLVGDADARITFAGSPQELQRALDTWTLDKFSFAVRPFNPHPSGLGHELHDLMVRDNIGRVQGSALPGAEHAMRDSREGLIAEAKGLTDAGYGQIAATGRTPSGHLASFSKPSLSDSKDKNKERQAQSRTLKVYIDPQPSNEEEEAAVVGALLEFYGE